MAKMTVTEALAEIKTIGKRLEKKKQFVLNHLVRHAIVYDPAADSGGSVSVIKQERQAIGDLEERLIAIRTAITDVNAKTPLSVLGMTRTIAEWLTWRREVAPGQRALLDSIRRAIEQTKAKVEKDGLVMTRDTEARTQQFVIVNVDDGELAKQIEDLETVLGTVDGALSLVNATTFVEIG